MTDLRVSDADRVLHDPERLSAVRRTGLLDSPTEEVFDRLTRLAAKLIGTPVTFISLVDEGRDYYKSCFGLEEPLASSRELTGTTFCHYALPNREPLVIPDTLADPVYREVPTVKSLGIRAYLGVPLVTSEEHAIGSFCAVDFKPRQWSAADIDVVRELAASALREIELRQEVADRRRAEQEREQLLRSERAAWQEAERRAVEERALRRAAQAVTASYTVEEASRRIAESAVEATRADGAFVERLDMGRNLAVVAAIAGERTPSLGDHVPFPGSFADLVLRQQRAELISDLSSAGRPLPGGLGEQCGDCSGLVVPLHDGTEPIGALILLRDPEHEPFRPDEIDHAQTFGDLAALAFRKIHLLEESERRRLELEEVTESRARLMRGFSHDLKNPLGAADGHAQLLADGILGSLAPRQYDSVRRIRNSLHNALELINELVDLARAEAGQLELELRSTDVRHLVLETAEEFRAQVESSGLSLDVVVPDPLPLIRSDSGRVRQVLGNLMSNAVKYSRKGDQVEVRVEIASRDGMIPDQWIAVAVSDTGIGVPANKLHLLFREFSRLETGTRPGAGLGLAISQRLAHALGGEITVESEQDQGSTFTLWLPLDEVRSDTHDPVA